MPVSYSCLGGQLVSSVESGWAGHTSGELAGYWRIKGGHDFVAGVT